jgi:hypothetical protein
VWSVGDTIEDNSVAHHCSPRFIVFMLVEQNLVVACRLQGSRILCHFVKTTHERELRTKWKYKLM